MDNIEQKFDNAVKSLKAGTKSQEILAGFSADQAPLLDLAKDLFAIPTATVPTPLMSRKYASTKPVSFFTYIFTSPRLTFAAVALILLSGTIATGYAANQSAPGDRLFAVKKSFESAQLALAGSQDSRASLQIEITQKRLQEAQTVLNNPSSDQQQKTAALNELASQTSTAVAEVNNATNQNPKADQNRPLLSSLDKITKQQQTLLSQITTDSQIKVAANQAQQSLNVNSAQISDIKQKVAIADSDQSLVKLFANPNAVAILGKVTKVSENQITVEKTTFIINSATIIQNLDGKNVSFKELSLNQQVNASGQKNAEGLVAKTIVIIPDDGFKIIPTVEGTSTPATSSPVTEVTNKKFAPSPSPTTIPNDPNSAEAKFILEDPAPQFAN